MSIDNPQNTKAITESPHSWNTVAASAYSPEAVTNIQTTNTSAERQLPSLPRLDLTNGTDSADKNSYTAADNNGNRVIGSEYRYGPRGREVHNITENEWNERSAARARHEVADAARHIVGHAGNTSSLLQDATDLRKALDHARQYLTADQLKELVKSLPGLTNNAVTVTGEGDNLKASLYVPFSLRRPIDSATDPTIFDARSRTRTQYPVPDDAHASPAIF